MKNFLRTCAVLAFTAMLSASNAAIPAPDKVEAAEGPISIQPINHATLVLSWNKKTMYVDPVGGAGRFEKMDPADVVLVTDIHGDHFDPETLKAVVGAKTSLIVPGAVAEKLPDPLKKKAIVMGNGEKKEVGGIEVEAVPMYNLTPDRLKFHSKGRGNGYVLTLGGKRIYFSGDTEDIPEMRALKQIDVAFVCMNLPYTMTEEQAASAVRDFKPRVVYPYHYRGSDTGKFKKLVGTETGIEVRLVDWYLK